MTPALLALALAAAPWSAQTEAQRAAGLARARSLPLDARLLEISAGFLGTPYQLSPLGEGEGPDPDPLVRYDAVDCLSLVEQTIAMALAQGPEAVVPLLNDIRYASGVSYPSRNHLMEAQWLPNNVKKGFLKDIGPDLAGDKVVLVRKRLDGAAWSGAGGRALDLPEPQRPLGEFSLQMIPVAHAGAALARAPQGALVVVVRKDRPNAVTRITHVGFLVHKKSGPYLRHASRTFKKAVDEELERYLARNLGYAKWTVEGFAVFQVVEPKLVTASPAAPSRR